MGEMQPSKGANLAQDLKKRTRQEIAQLMAQRWQHATDAIDRKIEDSKEAWNYYLENVPDPSLRGSQTGPLNAQMASTHGGRGFRLGLVPKTVDSALSFMHNATFPQDDRFFRGTPQNPISKENQEIYEEYLATQFGEANVVECFRQFRLAQILDGTACLHVKWDETKVKKYVWEMPTLDVEGVPNIELQEEPVRRNKEVTIFRGNKPEVLDFNDWRVDPSASCMEESWFQRRWYEEIHSVKEKYPWVSKDVLVPYADYRNAEDQTYVDARREDQGLEEMAFSINPKFEDDGKHKALMMCGYDDFIIDGKMYKNHMAVSINDCELVWFGPNPHYHGLLPYIVAPYNPIPKQIYGQSMVKHIIPSSELTDNLTENMQRTVELGANPTFTRLTRDRAFRRNQNFMFSSGLTIPVENHDSLRQVDVNIQNLAYLEQVLERLERNVQEVTGVNPFVSGDEPVQGRVSAFEIDQRVQGGNSRYQDKMTIFNNMVLEPFMVMAHENCKEHIDDAVMVDGEPLPARVIRQLNYKWTITSTHATMTRNRQLANIRGLFLEIIPPLMQAGLFQPKTAVQGDVYMALEKMMSLSGTKDGKDIFQAMPVPPLAAAPQEQNPPQQGASDGLPTAPPVPNEQAIGDAY